MVINPSPLRLGSSKNNVRRLLSNHVRRDRCERTRDTGEHGSINNTQPLCAADVEVAVQHGQLVIVGADRARRRGVVAPRAVLDVVCDFLGGVDVRAGQDLGDGDELAGEGAAGQCDGLGHGSDVLLVLADARVEVVVCDGGDVKRVGGLQRHGSGGVAGVGLQDCPGEEVVHGSGVDAVVGEVAAEVDGAAEGEDIPVVLLGYAGLVEHGSAEARGGVDAAVAEDGGVVALHAGVGVVTFECAPIKCGEVILD